MAAPKDLLERVLSLSATEKAELVDKLLSSLDRTDPEIDKLWATEAESRIDAYERGRLKAVSLEKVMEKYR